MTKPERFTARCPSCGFQISAVSLEAMKAAKDQHEHYHGQRALQES